MAALNPKLEIKITLDPAGVGKGAITVRKELAMVSKEIDHADSLANRFKKSLGAMWRITGGILLFNVIRHVTHSIRDLIGVAFDYEEQMRNVNSVAQLSEKDFAALNDELITLALDPRIKDGPAELAAGLYEVTSAGYSTKDALIILEQAAIAGTAGMTDTATAAQVLTSTLGAYNFTADKTEEVTNQLFQIVNISRYTFDDLANSMASVTPVASKLGLGLDVVGAAMATMAFQGVSAETATVNLNQILSGLLKPTEEMKKTIEALGYANAEAMLETLGFTETMKVFNDIIGGSETKAAALFGDVRALRGIMFLINGDGEIYNNMLKEMAKAQEDGGATARALEEQMKSNNFQLAVLRKNIEILAVLGFGVIAPYLNKALMGVNTFVAGSIEAFRHFRDKGYSNFEAFRAAVKKTLQSMFGSDVVTPVLKVIDTLAEAFDILRTVIRTVIPIVGSVFKVLIENMEVVAPILAVFVANWIYLDKILPIVKGITTAIKALRVATLTMLGPWTLVIAAIVLFAVAYRKNWFGIRDITDKVVGWVVDKTKPFISALVELGKYLKAVATGDIPPFGDALKKLPGWMQPVALILGRVVKTLRVFFKTWQDKGFLEAVKTIPTQIRAFGRAVSRFLDSIGLGRFSKTVKEGFYLISKIIMDVISLVDNVVHGRWKKAWENLGGIAINLVKFFLNYLKMLPALLVDIFEMIPWGRVGMALWNGFKAVLVWFRDTALPWMAVEAVAIMVGFYEAATEYWRETIGPWFNDRVVAITGAFVDSALWLYNIGNDIIKGLGDGIAWGWDWLIGWFSKLHERFKWYFANADKLLWQVGAELIMGLAHGIAWAWNWVVNWLEDLWNRLPGWAKKIWQIASPSKVFAAIGKEIPAGLAKGIKDGMGEVEQAMRGMDRATGQRSSRPYAPQLGLQSAGNNFRNMMFGPGAIIIHGAKGQDEDVLAEKVAQKVLRAADDRAAGQS